MYLEILISLSGMILKGIKVLQMYKNRKPFQKGKMFYAILSLQNV